MSPAADPRVDPVRDIAALTRAEVGALRWEVHPDPVITAPWPSPIVADPAFLPPPTTPGTPATPDGTWHLWAHSLIGLHHWTSVDGESWVRVGTVTRNALRPCVVDTGAARRTDRYLLAYEQPRAFVPFGLPWRSRIDARASADLWTWGEPVTLLRPALAWHRRGDRDAAVSNPCLVPWPDGRWRLYYSAGLVRLDDCGFDEPLHIGVADGPGPRGPFTPRPEPLLSAEQGDALANLGAGAMKVLRVADGWVAFQNAISWDPARQRSGSAIRVLGSADGDDWEVLARPAELAPTGSGWRGSHVYALDVRTTPEGVRMMFNARDVAAWSRGREAIGTAGAYGAAGDPRHGAR